ncbi:MAG: transpeptidase family protein [Treponema sp.]|nr:transpeptidase family protein [Treponema sp.]
MSTDDINESGRMSARFSSKKRFIIFVVLFCMVSIGVFARYGYLMLFTDEAGTVYRRTNTGRSMILDRNGRLMAIDTRLGNVTLSKSEMENPEELSRVLAPYLEQTPVEILRRINDTQGNFLYLKRRISETVVEQIKAAIKTHGLKGVGIEEASGRIYPGGSLASQIIGFVGNDGYGLAGIEYAFDSELRAAAGNSTGGNQVYLTLDMNVQHILERIGKQVLEENKAEAVMFMAMDPRTGDILGSASLPNYDPNMFQNYSDAERMDRTAIWSYEPGPVLKVFSLSALANSGAISQNTFCTCNGHYERTTSRGEKITINCMSAHGNVSAREIIIYSCNAGAAYAADRLGAQAFYDQLKSLGFGTRTGIGSPGETAGFLAATERWSDRSKPTIAMGQEIAVSALQMLQAASAIANDGILVTPRIIDRIVSADGKTVKPYEADPPREVLTKETAKDMRSYMMDVTSDIGTAWRANVADISLAVKTGTAQLIDTGTGSYSSTDFIASCLALLPAESPSLVLYLVIVKPQGASYLGGRIAAPPIREAAEELINYLGIPRGRNPQVTHSGTILIPETPSLVVYDTVPDFTGIAKRLLLPLTLRNDLRLQINGEGWVARQSPAPGTLLNAQTVIVLDLE